MIDLVLATLSAHLVVAPIAVAPEPCDLVTAAEIAAALGITPSDGKTSTRPHVDDTGGEVKSCIRNVGSMFLDVSVAELADAGAADKLMTTLATREPSDEDEAKMVAASGVGDRSLFGATKIGAHWIAQKGKFMISVTLAGELGNGARYKESLKKLAAAALTRL